MPYSRLPDRQSRNFAKFVRKFRQISPSFYAFFITKYFRKILKIGVKKYFFAVSKIKNEGFFSAYYKKSKIFLTFLKVYQNFAKIGNFATALKISPRHFGQIFASPATQALFAACLQYQLKEIMQIRKGFGKLAYVPCIKLERLRGFPPLALVGWPPCPSPLG